MYSEDDYLMLSGIQHFLFCPRQWALIHIEQIWQENSYTAEGQRVHEKVDLPFLKEKRGDRIISRAMDVSSKRLGLSGRLDVIEFRRADQGVTLKGRKGKWQPTIIEYKRGKKKKGDYDHVQLMAQAICIEEMLGVSMEAGYMYYHQTDTRERVDYTDRLRKLVEDTAREMHACYRAGIVPKASFYKNCTLCSLYDLCQPRLTKKAKHVGRYIYEAEL